MFCENILDVSTGPRASIFRIRLPRLLEAEEEDKTAWAWRWRKDWLSLNWIQEFLSLKMKTRLLEPEDEDRTAWAWKRRQDSLSVKTKLRLLEPDDENKTAWAWRWRQDCFSLKTKTRLLEREDEFKTAWAWRWRQDYLSLTMKALRKQRHSVTSPEDSNVQVNTPCPPNCILSEPVGPYSPPWGLQILHSDWRIIPEEVRRRVLLPVYVCGNTASSQTTNIC